mgnify:CR=1 FL=1
MMLYSKFHAKSGPFWGNKVEQGNLFLFVWHVLSVSTGGYRTELTAAEKQLVPCQVCLEIDRDGAVGLLVHYY